jgi:D-alanine-D-alanine ligase
MDITLLFGGRSTEHQFSIEMFDHFATHLAATPDKRIEVKNVVYVDPKGLVHASAISNVRDLLELRERRTHPAPVQMTELAAILKANDGFVFSLIQGREGEDGRYQGLADLLDIRGNFGAVYPAAVGIDKWTFSLVADHITGGALTPIPTRVLAVDACDAELEDTVQYFRGTECILKPNTLNGSLFTRSVHGPAKTFLRDYLKEMVHFDDRILVQKRIHGRELTCGCIRIDGELRALPVGEIGTGGALFSYKTKYGAGGYEVGFPDAASAVAKEIERVSIALARFMRFHTMCRFDYIVGSDDQLHLLEVNPSPGLLSESILPRLLKRAGLTIVDLIVFSIANDEAYRARRSQQNGQLEKWKPMVA